MAIKQHIPPLALREKQQEPPFVAHIVAGAGVAVLRWVQPIDELRTLWRMRVERMQRRVGDRVCTTSCEATSRTPRDEQLRWLSSVLAG